MKLKRFLLPLIALFTLAFIATGYYLLLNNLDSDIAVKATSNNNVVLNYISDISARDNSTINNNYTTESTNSTLNFNDDSNRTKVIVGVGITIGVFIFLGLTYGKWHQVGLRLANRGDVNTPTSENIEMSSAMPTFNNNN